MKEKLKFLFKVTLGLVLLAGLGWGLTRDVFRIKDFSIDPMTSTKPEGPTFKKVLFKTIQDNLKPKLTEFSGKYLWEVDLEGLRSRILDEPRIKSVHIRRRFPDKVDIRYSPHKPKFLYMSKSSEFFPVTKTGSLLPKSSLLEWGSLPIFRGSKLSRDKKTLQLVSDFVGLMPETGVFSLATISEIQFSKKLGLQLTLSKSKTIVRLGQSQYFEKINRVKKVLSYLDSKKLSARVIDARFLKKVVVKPRNTP